MNDANWEPSSATAYDGEYSIRIQSQTTPNTDPDLRWELPGTVRPDRIRFHFYEYDNQQNGAIAFLNKDGEIVSGGGTNSPQWTVWRKTGASGENWYQGDGFERWVRFTFDFDWERSEIMLTGEDLASGTTRQTIAHFLTQDPISSVVISSNNFQAGNSGYNVASGSNQRNPKSMHFDEIEIL